MVVLLNHLMMIKSQMLLFKGGKDTKTLFKHVGKVLETDNYSQSIRKIKDGLNSSCSAEQVISNFFSR